MSQITVGQLLAVLSDQYFEQDDELVHVNGKLMIGRHTASGVPIIVGEVNMKTGTLSRGFGLKIKQEPCSAGVTQ